MNRVKSLRARIISQAVSLLPRRRNTAPTPPKPDYGIDAPGVIRNLAIAGALMFAMVAAVMIGLLPPALVIPLASVGGISIGLTGTGLGAGLGFSATACWMYWGSRVGKLNERDSLLNRIQWKGDERVLDIGCGRGLMLIGAARRLTTGSAVGVDIWQKEDLSGNSPEVPLKNAELEGVAGRVSVETADMRRLPFDDGSFDVVVSRAAIHNLYSAADRAAAIREIARVLRPGGRALISDIRHHQEYARTFVQSGCSDVRLLDSRVFSLLCAVATMGALRPNTMLVKKAAHP